MPKDADAHPAPEADTRIDGRFELEEHPNAALRRPLTVLCVLAPLGLLAEIYRLLSERKARLLTEEQWTWLGAHVGIDGPMVPVLVLVIGCLVVQLVRRYDWALPGPALIARLAAWAAVWALVRYLVGFTALRVSATNLPPSDALDRLPALAQLGLAMSGALQEELIFRAGLVSLFALIARALGAKNALAQLIAVPLAAVLFSLAHTEIVNHHPGSEPFTFPSFLQRLVAGCLYGYIYVRQGLAVSTLAHCGYNIAVIWRLGPWP